MKDIFKKVFGLIIIAWGLALGYSWLDYLIENAGLIDWDFLGVLYAAAISVGILAQLGVGALLVTDKV